MEGRGIMAWEFHWGAFVGVGQGIETLRFFLTLPVDHQVTRNGEEPGLELGLAVVLVAALQDAYPCFLEKILGALAIASDVKQIAEQPVLILLDQAVEQLGIAASQPKG